MFIPRRNLELVRFKCNVTIINCHLPLENVFVELTDTRVWITDVYEGVYFSADFKSAISKDIKKKLLPTEWQVVVGGLSILIIFQLVLAAIKN